jgi:hypothetical protein
MGGEKDQDGESRPLYIFRISIREGLDRGWTEKRQPIVVVALQHVAPRLKMMNGLMF